MTRVLVLACLAFVPLYASAAPDCGLTTDPPKGSLTLLPDFSTGHIPLILIHGDLADVRESRCGNWSTLLSRLPRDFSTTYRIYLFMHDTSKSIGFKEGGNAEELGDAIDRAASIPSSSRIGIIAHSRGGLVARAFMNNFHGGQGNRVFGLITLGTPHRGAPGAVADWGLWALKQNFRWRSSCVTNAIYNTEDEATYCLGQEGPVAVNYTRTGTTDLAWDGFDNDIAGVPYVSSFKVAGASGNIPHTLSARDLNIEPPPEGEADTDVHQATDNGSLDVLNATDRFLDRLAAYGGYFSDPTGGDVANGAFGGQRERYLFAAQVQATFPLAHDIPAQYAANDGLVPLQSALLFDAPISGTPPYMTKKKLLGKGEQVKYPLTVMDEAELTERSLAWRIHVFKDYAHNEIREGRQNGDPLITALEDDLRDLWRRFGSPEPPPTPNNAPTAAFLMTAPGVVLTAPGTLTVSADRVTNKGLIRFDDRSSDLDWGDTLSRLWITTDTGCESFTPPPCELSTGEGFSWGFAPGGPYIVRLTVTDRAGASSHIEASIVVRAAAPSPELFLDAASDPQGRFAGASLDRLMIDASANLRVISYHGSFPPVARINSVASTGAVLWQTASVTGVFSIPGATLKVGAHGRSYLGEGQIIYAYEADGATASGWPLSFSASDSNLNSLLAGLLVGEDGSVYAKSGVFSSFSSFPSAVFRVEADGSPGWRTAFPDGAHRIGVFEGPGRDIYTVIEDQLVRLDHATGAPVCWAQTDSGTSPFGSFLAGAAGAYSARGQTMLAFDGTCFLSGRLDAAGSLRVLYVVGNRVILAESSLQPTGPAIPKLIGTDEQAHLLWTNDTLVPELTWGTALQVHRGKTLYVIGTDRSDPPVPLLFLVDADTGTIQQRIPRRGVCDDICNIAVAPDGTIYLTQTGSTKIYRVRFQ